jgi:hypothetical protein
MRNFFAGKALTYYGRWTYKYEEAARKGGCRSDSDSPNRDGQLWLGRRAQFVLRRKVVSQSSTARRSLRSAAWIQSRYRETPRLPPPGMNLDKMIADAQFARLPAGDAAREIPPVGTHDQQEFVRFTSNNVIAVLQGSDPQAKETKA